MITYDRQCFPTAYCNIVVGALGTVEQFTLTLHGKGEGDGS